MSGLGITFIAYMVFGMIAMKVVNIPMYTTLRRTTVVFVMFLEYLLSSKTSSFSIKLSVGLMILGALVAGIRDLNFDLAAYGIVVVYNLCTASYLVLINIISTQEKTNAEKAATSSSSGAPYQKLDKYDMMLYNNIISIPLLCLIILFTGETTSAMESPYWSDAGFVTALLASSILAFVLNYTIFWNTSANSALTQTVSGQAKDIVVVFLGFLLFDDAHFDPINILGVLIGFAGSIMYAMMKIKPEWGMEIERRLGVTTGGVGGQQYSLLPLHDTSASAANGSVNVSRAPFSSYAPSAPHHLTSGTTIAASSSNPNSPFTSSPIDRTDTPDHQQYPHHLQQKPYARSNGNDVHSSSSSSQFHSHQQQFQQQVNYDDQPVHANYSHTYGPAGHR